LLILGGRGKGQDFTLLREAVAERAAHVYVIGEDGPRIADALAGLPCTRVETLAEAVEHARRLAHRGQVVLLSPACASFDQFDDFEARGDAFRMLVDEQA
jgi:UDP-N-acetylmuramoylalanine--D-glutamate ligase